MLLTRTTTLRIFVSNNDPDPYFLLQFRFRNIALQPIEIFL